MKCPKCGATIEGGYRYLTCQNCGRTYDSKQLENVEEPEPIIAPSPKPEPNNVPKPTSELEQAHSPESKPKPATETEPVAMLEPDSPSVLEPESVVSFESVSASKTESIHDLSLTSDSKSTTDSDLDPESAADIKQTLDMAPTAIPEPPPISKPTPDTENTPKMESSLPPEPKFVTELTPNSEPSAVPAPTPVPETSTVPEPTLVAEPTTTPEQQHSAGSTTGIYKSTSENGTSDSETPSAGKLETKLEAKSTPEPVSDSEKIPASSNLFKNKKLWIVVALLSIIIIGAIVFAITSLIGSDNSSSTIKSNNKTKVGSGSFNEQRVIDELYIDEYELDNKYVVVFQNNSDHIIDLTGEATFYDRNGNKIDVGINTEQTLYSLGPNQEDCMIFETESYFSDADLKLSAEESDSNYEPVDFKLKDFSAYANSNIAFMIQNQGERTRDPIAVKFLFYDDGKLIDTSQAFYLQPFNTGDTLPNSANLEIDDFDRYECYIDRLLYSGKTGQSPTFDASRINSYLKTKEYKPSKQFLIVSVENISSYNLDVYGTIATYSSDGSLQNAYDDMIHALGPGEKYLLYFHIDEDYSYKDFKISIGENQEESSLTNYLKLGNVEQHGNKVAFDLKNTGNVDAEHVEVVFLFFKNDKLVDWDSTGPEDYSLDSGETASLVIDIPDGDPEDIEYFIKGYDNQYTLI